MEFKIDNLVFEEIDLQLTKLSEIARAISQENSVSIHSAIMLTNHTGYCNALEDATEEKATSSLGIGAVFKSIWLAIKNSIQYILNLVWKAAQWIFNINGYRNGNKNTEKESVNQKAIGKVEETLKDKDIVDALKEAEANPSAKKAMEDATPDLSINISDVFDKFKESLSEQEIDFITSGKRYKLIRSVVEDFTRYDYSTTITDYASDVEFWVRRGLEEGPHVGRSEDSVEDFVNKKTKELNDLRNKHFLPLDNISKLEVSCRSGEVHSDPQYLNLFQRKPSTLFPHLEHLWSSLHFSKLKEEDKRLFKNLETMKKGYERTMEHIEKLVNMDESSWPPLVEMAKMSNKVIHESSRIIVTLVRVVTFIRNSARIAFEATLKAFTYIKNLLHAIGKVPGIDKEKVDKAVTVIQDRYKDLHSLLVIAA